VRGDKSASLRSARRWRARRRKRRPRHRQLQMGLSHMWYMRMRILPADDDAGSILMTINKQILRRSETDSPSQHTEGRSWACVGWLHGITARFSFACMYTLGERLMTRKYANETCIGRRLLFR
jgi:hypothetical protein